METGKLSPVKIRIRQFQSIEDLEIEVRGFTCVTGKSNIGKSAIIRAVSSSILNEPAVGMVRKGAAFASVEVRADGWGFTWEKGERGVNRYTIDGSVLDKVGQSQLEHVAKMGFFPVKVGSRKINPWYAPQFSPIFLLDESGPAVTDFISEVSRLQVLQDAIVLSARGRKRALDEAKQRAEEAAASRARESKVRELDGLERVGVELEQQAASIEQYEARILKAEGLQAGLDQSRRILKAVEPAARVRVPSVHLDEHMSRFKASSGWNTKLVAAAHRILSIQGGSKAPAVNVPEPPSDERDELARAAKYAHVPGLARRVEALSAAARAKVPADSGAKEAMDSLRAVTGLQRRLGTAAKGVRALSADARVPEPPGMGGLARVSDLLSRLEAAKKSVAQLEERSSKLGDEADGIRKELDAIPSCPTCGRVGDGAHRHQAAAGASGAGG